MKAASSIAGALVAVSQFMGAFAEQEKGKQPPKQLPIPDGLTSQGCFQDIGNFTESDVKPRAVSSGSCREFCIGEKYTVFGLSGQVCYCGFAYPPEDSLADDKKCNYPCPGYPYEACGGLGNPGYVSVYNMGVELSPPFYEPEEEDGDDDGDDKPSTTSTAPSETSTSPSEEETSAPQTTETNEPTASSDPSADDGKKEESGPNVAGIAAGVVVGIVIVAGACGGLWFYMRRKRNNEIEEEHRRNAAVNAFISGSKPPGSSGSISMTDSRLDPVMAHRRLSDGSIADNEDYSRKILRVTNA